MKSQVRVFTYEWYPSLASCCEFLTKAICDTIKVLYLSQITTPLKKGMWRNWRLHQQLFFFSAESLKMWWRKHGLILHFKAQPVRDLSSLGQLYFCTERLLKVEGRRRTFWAKRRKPSINRFATSGTISAMDAILSTSFHRSVFSFLNATGMTRFKPFRNTNSLKIVSTDWKPVALVIQLEKKYLHKFREDHVTPI